MAHHSSLTPAFGSYAPLPPRVPALHPHPDAKAPQYASPYPGLAGMAPASPTHNGYPYPHMTTQSLPPQQQQAPSSQPTFMQNAVAYTSYPEIVPSYSQQHHQLSTHTPAGAGQHMQQHQEPNNANNGLEYRYTTGQSFPAPSLHSIPNSGPSKLTLPPTDGLAPGAYAIRPAPTTRHVVGQQGKRGIIPSTTGAIVPPMTKTELPGKNEKGRYSCNHCHKEYKHLKHLKRHMLRHTGERPYSCILCSDQFSRSDILKRHFQKCAERRGLTAQGLDHLQGSRGGASAKRRIRGSSGSEQSVPTAIF